MMIKYSTRSNELKLTSKYEQIDTNKANTKHRMDEDGLCW